MPTLLVCVVGGREEGWRRYFEPKPLWPSENCFFAASCPDHNLTKPSISPKLCRWWCQLLTKNAQGLYVSVTAGGVKDHNFLNSSIRNPDVESYQLVYRWVDSEGSGGEVGGESDISCGGFQNFTGPLSSKYTVRLRSLWKLNNYLARKRKLLLILGGLS